MRASSQAYSQEHALLAHRVAGATPRRSIHDAGSRRLARLGATAVLLLLMAGGGNVAYLRHSLYERKAEAAQRLRQELEINGAVLLDSDISVESSSSPSAAAAQDQQQFVDSETSRPTNRKPLFPEPLVPPLSGRGIVLPLYDEIAATGISLVLELRAMDVDLPIEVPHCGDLQPQYQELLAQRDQLVRIYDVCALALQDRDEEDDPRFCATLAQCHERFRGFDVKVLAVVFSRFQELMLMDADTLFFQSPMRLWTTDKYTTTGTLFFHDRICSDKYFLADIHPGSYPFISRHQFFLSKFDLTDFESLANIPRSNKASGPAERVRDDPETIVFPFEPSDFLVTSHSSNRRTGHEMDSSLLLWNKQRQPRATAILASFVSLNGPGRPPGFGDKELYFSACELAETAYAFTDFGVGSIGFDQRTVRDRKTTRPFSVETRSSISQSRLAFRTEKARCSTSAATVPLPSGVRTRSVCIGLASAHRRSMPVRLTSTASRRSAPLTSRSSRSRLSS